MKKILLLALVCYSMCSACKKDKGPTNIVSDIDGNTYKTITIGTQTWMAENLKTTRLNNGQLISYIPNFFAWKDVNYNFPMMTYYAYDYSNFEKYGTIYNFSAVETGMLAPKGWHVATDEDWEKLKNYLISNGFNYDGSTVNDKIAKSLAATSGWQADNTIGNIGMDQNSNNKSGFNGLAGGFMYINNVSGFLGLEVQTNWWASTGDSATKGMSWCIYNNDWASYKQLSEKRNGLYVRCVKD
jgi:uncharacterized protein (TIGR02145 family)